MKLALIVYVPTTNDGEVAQLAGSPTYPSNDKAQRMEPSARKVTTPPASDGNPTSANVAAVPAGIVVLAVASTVIEELGDTATGAATGMPGAVGTKRPPLRRTPSPDRCSFLSHRWGTKPKRCPFRLFHR